MSFFEGRRRFVVFVLAFSIREIRDECFMRRLSSLVDLKVSSVVGNVVVTGRRLAVDGLDARARIEVRFWIVGACLCQHIQP